MTNKMMAMTALMGCLLAGNLMAEQTATIASVDLNRVQNEVGYQRLVFIDADDDVKAEMIKLRNTLNQAIVACVKEEDEGKLAILQTKIQSINNKINTIRNAMSNRGGHDGRKALVKFIAGRYSKKYTLIIDAQMVRGGGQIIVWNASAATDLTDEVIEALEQELP